MDLDLTKSRRKIVKEASRIAEDCGYAGDNHGQKLTLQSQDWDIVKITFDDKDKVKFVHRSTDEGKTWETLNFKENLFEVDAGTLVEYNRKIEYGTQQRLPMAQGSMMNEIVKSQKITNVIKWGYHFDLMGLETPSQFLLWRDCGSHAEFLGIINKGGK